MALIPCPQCGQMISPEAPTCPACGHPIAAAKRKSQTAAGIGCGGIMLVIIGFLAYAINEGGKIQEQEKAHPTCASDYTKCSDNKDVIQHHQSKDGISMQVECEEAGKQAAKYGTPEFPFLPFGTYYTGRSYIDSGTAILIEK